MRLCTSSSRSATRRSVLFGATALATAALAGPVLGQTMHRHRLGIRMRPPAPGLLGGPGAVLPPLPQPRDLRLSEAPQDLVMKEGTFQLGGRTAVNMRVYEGQPMGPTLRMGANGTYRVRVVNQLPLNPDQAEPHIVNVPSQFNTANLHTHGLHVTPNTPGDDIYIEILPEGTDHKYVTSADIHVGSFTNEYTLVNHTPGTFWYHPHRHGSVAVQVASGAAGALIVEGGDDTIDGVPGIKGVKEQVMLVQQITFIDGEPLDFEQLWNFRATADWGLNGTTSSAMSMQPGEVQRWRFVNTGFQDMAKLMLTADPAPSGTSTPYQVQLIAMDGVNFVNPVMVDAIYLPPGGRADIMVQAPAAAGNQLVLLAGGYSDFTAGFEIDGTMRGSPFSSAPSQILAVAVGGEPRPMPLPTGPFPPPKVPALTPDTKPDKQRYLVYASATFPDKDPHGYRCKPEQGYNPNDCRVLKFQLNGELFAPGRVMFEPVLGTVEEYFVTTTDGFPHVFHIHVNPFLVTEVAGKTLSRPQWRDTMIFDDKGYRALTMYTDYLGMFPIHCHILDHEDVGMMTNVAVVASPVDRQGSYMRTHSHRG